MSPTLLGADALARDLSIRDLSDPTQGPHALQLLLDELVASLRRMWPATEIRVIRADPVVTLADNYWHLGYEPDAVTVDARYTRYVDEKRILRSHSTALIPPALRELAATAGMGQAETDILLVCPGLCYRRDAVDRLHTGTPHQVDLWRVTDGRQLNDTDLEEMIAGVVGGALPGASWRTVATGHPYTTGGRQIDAGTATQTGPPGQSLAALSGEQWVEIGECGLAAPAILAGCGLPATRTRTQAGIDVGAPTAPGGVADRPWSGLAMGVGLDRMLMLRKGIPDIRLLRSTDPRVTAQLLDLSRYRMVSTLPSIRRDLSIAVSEETDASAEVLGDQVREALGIDADAIESVALLATAEYADVPDLARRRLGLRPGQRNLLVRVILRPLDRTLTDPEANELRDRIYAALHQGSAADSILSCTKRISGP
jgi:phenylalanyl-tRNA synthetase alpha chain